MDQGSGLLLPDLVREPPGVPKGPRPVRDLRGLAPVLARAGALELRLATTRKEIRAVQRLRYEVFYRLGDAVPDAYKAALERDKCPFDRSCDHLFVVDTASSEPRGKPRVAGTTRLLRSDVAAAQDGFYSATEFAVERLAERHPGARLLELGRSCVHPDYRARRVIDLLWQGIGRYAAHHGSEVLIGCSSLAGTWAESLAVPLSFAYHFARAPEAWQVPAETARAVRMDWLPREAVDPRAALATLPPLMKAYVRAGATFAAQAAIDHQFGTTDLFTVLPFAAASPRYITQFGPALRPGAGWAPGLAAATA